MHTHQDFLGYPQGHLFYGMPLLYILVPAVLSRQRGTVLNQHIHILAGYELAHRAETGWADTSAAMYMLIRAAVHQPMNAYFVLLSEACLPLYPATAVYLEIIHEPRSRTRGVQPFELLSSQATCLAACWPVDLVLLLQLGARERWRSASGK